MKQILVAADQLMNALLGGFADETLSARCYRCRHRQPYAFLKVVIDGLFFWQFEHCKQSYMSEALRRQLPPEYRTWQ